MIILLAVVIGVRGIVMCLPLFNLAQQRELLGGGLGAR
jgi:hypothetical protein